MADSDEKKGSGKLTPEPVGFSLDAGGALTVKTTCGDCRHFNRMAHPHFANVCELLGVGRANKPCKRFRTDPRTLRITEDELVLKLAEVMAGISTAKLPALAALINAEKFTRNQRLNFGEVRYLKIFGGDYISNYRRCHVITADKKYVHIEGGGGFTATVYHSSTLSATQWKKKHRELTAENKLVDPNLDKYYEVKVEAQRDRREVLSSKDALLLSKRNASSSSVLSAENTKRVTAAKLGKKLNTKQGSVPALDRLIRTRG